MTSLTLVTLAVMLLGLLNRRGYARALALGGATPVGAALVSGQVAVPTFYAVALGAALGLLGALLARSHRLQRVDLPRAPGVLPLLLFSLWTLLITLVVPFLFDGVAVSTPAGIGHLVAGALTRSNEAQLIYLLLGLAVVVFLTRCRWAGPQIIGTAAGLATVLSAWSYLNYMTGFPFPTGFFDNSPYFAFITTAPGGVQRFRGIFSEPSGLGGSSLVTIAYMVVRARDVTGLRRAGVVTLAALAAYLGWISTSATFVVAAVALVVIAAATAAGRFLLRRGPLSPLAATAACAAGIALLWALPVLVNAIGQVVDDKVTSSSYTERSGADTFAYRLVLDTWGLGSGLGSDRASSFGSTMLATVGVVGVGLFVAVVWVVVRGGYRVREVHPVVWALLALLTTKVIGGPDLGDTSGILWMSIGVLARAAMAPRAAPAPAFTRLPALLPIGPVQLQWTRTRANGRPNGAGEVR